MSKPVRIAIAEKFQPFVHEAGIPIPLPRTDKLLRIYPARIEIGDSTSYTLALTGPVRQFTAQLDLEQDQVIVWGWSEEGFFRYRIYGEDGNIVLYADKVPEGGVHIEGPSLGLLQIKSAFVLGHCISFPLNNYREKLSCGVNKQQSWEKVKQRKDTAEWIPLIYALAQTKPIAAAPLKAAAFFLNQAELALQSGDCVHFQKNLEHLLSFECEALLTPCTGDLSAWGIQTADEREGSLIHEVSSMVRRALVHFEYDTLALMPCAPPHWHAGRLTNLSLESLGSLDLEWTKKMPYRAIIRCKADVTLHLKLPKGLTHCRLRIAGKESGQELIHDAPYTFKAGITYWLDRFG